MLFDVLVQREFPQRRSDLLDVDVQHLSASCTVPQRPGKMEESRKQRGINSLKQIISEEKKD